mmetsp:Transcript_27146/g.26810  ORF Transcript_27146/g.26810 Transcript_27146/m.26810 type:complete len:252 (+) Transcript_27146:13-768(+)
MSSDQTNEAPTNSSPGLICEELSHLPKPLRTDLIPFELKYTSIEKTKLLEKLKEARNELIKAKAKREERKDKYGSLQNEVEELKKKLEIVREERDQAIGERFMMKAKILEQDTYHDIIKNNLLLEEKLVQIKLEHATLSQELESSLDDLECLKSLVKIRDNELLHISKEMEKAIKQKDLLNEKLGNYPSPMNQKLAPKGRFGVSSIAHIGSMFSKPPVTSGLALRVDNSKILPTNSRIIKSRIDIDQGSKD